MNSSGTNANSRTFKKPKIGIIGGFGMCSFSELKIISTIHPETKYGLPSDEILICEYCDQTVAFLPRHGKNHTLAPHKIPYKANISALKDIGVEYIIGTCIAGSLKKEITPGSIVLLDQFVNLTWGRDDYSDADSGSFIHLPMGEPYCKHLRQKILEAGKISGIEIIPQGTSVVIQGPRFSTKAESQWFSSNGWDIVNMTQYPECYFARELGICYVSIAGITDYDVGLQTDFTFGENNKSAIIEVFKRDIQKTKNILLAFLQQSGKDLSCKCASFTLKNYYEESL